MYVNDFWNCPIDKTLINYNIKVLCFLCLGYVEIKFIIKIIFPLCLRVERSYPHLACQNHLLFHYLFHIHDSLYKCIKYIILFLYLSVCFSTSTISMNLRYTCLGFAEPKVEEGFILIVGPKI